MSVTSQWWRTYLTLDNDHARFGAVNGNNYSAASTEADEATVIASAGAALTLNVKLSASPGGAGKSYRFQLSVNGVASTVLDTTISTAATTGIATGSVAIAAGDLITIKVTPTGTPTNSLKAEIWLEFEPTTANKYCYPGGFAAGGFLSSAPQFSMLFQQSPQAGSSSALTRALSAIAGQITAFYVSIETAPGGATSWDFVLTQNGSEVAASAINISGSNKTGNVTGLTIAVAVGDYFEFKVKAKNGAASGTGGISCCVVLVPTTTTQFLLCGNTNTTAATGATNYSAPAGANVAYDATEANVQMTVPGTFRFVGMAWLLGAAPASGKSWAFQFRKNTANVNLHCTVANAATTGSDVLNSDSVVSGDLVDTSCTPSGTPTSMSNVVWGFALTSSLASSGAGGRQQLVNGGLVNRGLANAGLVN